MSIRAVDGQGFNFPPGTGAAVLAEVDGNQQEAVFSELAQLWEIATRTGPKRRSSPRTRGSGRSCGRRGGRSASPSGRSRSTSCPRTSSSLVRASRRSSTSCKAIGQAVGLVVATYGHAGDGNLHANILFDSAEQRPTVDEALRQMAVVAIEVGGTITGEHGIGVAKNDLLPLEQSPAVLALQRKLKALFDPDGFLNPGKFLRSSRRTSKREVTGPNDVSDLVLETSFFWRPRLALDCSPRPTSPGRTTSQRPRSLSLGRSLRPTSCPTDPARHRPH